MPDEQKQPQSLIPYERWTDDVLREVVVRALEFAAAEGLPGEHHFYLTFRTDHPRTKVPGHLKARYPQEMTIVLQHQFEALTVNRAERSFSVRLYFGGVPATLVVPFAALTGFADPHTRYGLRFEPQMELVAVGPVAVPQTGSEAEAQAAEAQPAAEPAPTISQIVSLDAFRRRPSRE